MTSRSRGGEGGCQKHDIVREVAWIYSYDQPKMRDKGGGGSKNPKMCVTSFMDGPLGNAGYTKVHRVQGIHRATRVWS